MVRHMPYDIRCRQCGAHRRARNKNTTHCYKCRLLRNLEFVAEFTRSCQDCKAKFAPISRNDPYCGRCALGRSTNTGTCIFCQEPDTYFIQIGVPVCKECARAPERRRAFIAALQRGLRERKERNNATA